MTGFATHEGALLDLAESQIDRAVLQALHQVVAAQQEAMMLGAFREEAIVCLYVVEDVDSWAIYGRLR